MSTFHWDDETIVDSLRSSNDSDENWQLLYEKYAYPIVGLAYKVTRDHHFALDVLQSTFIKAFQKIKELRDGGSVKSWLLSIAFNEARQILRKNGRETIVDLEVLEPLISERQGEDVTFDESTELLSIAKKCLKGDERRVWILRFQGALSYSEIHQATGIPLNTVRSHLRRARMKLENSPQVRAILGGAL